MLPPKYFLTTCNIAVASDSVCAAKCANPSLGPSPIVRSKVHSSSPIVKADRRLQILTTLVMRATRMLEYSPMFTIVVSSVFMITSDGACCCISQKPTDALTVINVLKCFTCSKTASKKCVPQYFETLPICFPWSRVSSSCTEANASHRSFGYQYAWPRACTVLVIVDTTSTAFFMYIRHISTKVPPNRLAGQSSKGSMASIRSRTSGACIRVTFGTMPLRMPTR